MQKLLLVYYHSENHATSQIWKLLSNMVFPWGGGWGGGGKWRRSEHVHESYPGVFFRPLGFSPYYLAYGSCARSTSGSQNLGVLPKGHDNGGRFSLRSWRDARAGGRRRSRHLPSRNLRAAKPRVKFPPATFGIGFACRPLLALLMNQLNKPIRERSI